MSLRELQKISKWQVHNTAQPDPEVLWRSCAQATRLLAVTAFQPADECLRPLGDAIPEQACGARMPPIATIGEVTIAIGAIGEITIATIGETIADLGVRPPPPIFPRAVTLLSFQGQQSGVHQVRKLVTV